MLPPTLRFMMGVEQAHPSAIDAMLEQAIAEYDSIEGDPDMEDGTDAEDEFVLGENALQWGRWHGAGCPIGDPGGGAVDDEGEAIDEREIEQMHDDVPTVAVRDLDGNFLGFSNLLTSFRCNGGSTRSADSGLLMKRYPRSHCRKFGVPV